MKYWNLSKQRHAFRAADGFVVSIPKSGRTWLHFLIQHYHCAKRDIPFAFYPDGNADYGIPSIKYTHDLWHHRSVKKTLERLQGKYLIPEDCRATKPLLLLTRDLRDVMVSLYFQATKRSHKFSGTLSQLLVHPILGAEATVDIINLWWDEWHENGRFLHTTYENVKNSTEQELMRILAHFGETEPDVDLVAQAVKFASFKNVQEMERNPVIRYNRMMLGDVGDPESFKVRRGIVGGYLDYLSDQDIAIVDNAMKRLMPRPTGAAS